ncbi:uncharacterized protein JCM10292_005356 [Rhodotorula paludigena]|uniref:uncharacterized protein n=1 Tax=Rhodotorula paludigena TaxID=86838 RepID=UPI0031703BBA
MALSQQHSSRATSDECRKTAFRVAVPAASRFAPSPPSPAPTVAQTASAFSNKASSSAPTQHDFDEAVRVHVASMNKTKQGRTVFTPELHDIVRDIVQHPGSSLYGTSNDRWWVKQKGFTIGKDINGVVRVHCKEKGNLAARPVALVDELFGIIEAAHVCDGQHLGGDRTFEAVQKSWAKVTKDLVRLYIGLCPTCSLRWVKPLQAAEKNEPRKAPRAKKARKVVQPRSKKVKTTPDEVGAAARSSASVQSLGPDPFGLPTPPPSFYAESTSASTFSPSVSSDPLTPPPSATLADFFLPVQTPVNYLARRELVDLSAPLTLKALEVTSPSPFRDSCSSEPIYFGADYYAASSSMSRTESSATTSTLATSVCSDSASWFSSTIEVDASDGAAVDFGEWLSEAALEGCEDEEFCSGNAAGQTGWRTPTRTSEAKSLKRSERDWDDDCALDGELDTLATPTQRNRSVKPLRKRRFVDDFDVRI